MVFGFTSSFRMGQILQFQLKVPDHDPRLEDYKYMCTSFIEAVRSCLKTYGFNETFRDADSGGTFLVGYKGSIYEIEDDYQVGIRTGTFNSVGCGSELALGAMFATSLGEDSTEGEFLAEPEGLGAELFDALRDKIFQTVEEEGTPTKTFYDTTITLIPKPKIPQKKKTISQYL